MGQDVAKTQFTREDRQQYRQKVRRSLDVFARMLAESRFDVERRSMGLEIELNLTDERGDPAMVNEKVLDLIADEDFQTELAQFNIEINIPPQKIEGAVFQTLETEVRASLNHADDMSKQAGADVVITSRKPMDGAALEGVRKRFGGSISNAVMADSSGAATVLEGAQLLLNCGPAGVTLVPRDAWAGRPNLIAAADLNAVPPLGVEGVEVMDKAVDREGVLCY